MKKLSVLYWLVFIVAVIMIGCSNNDTGDNNSVNEISCSVEGTLEDLSTFSLIIDGQHYYTEYNNMTNPWAGYGFSDIDKIEKVYSVSKETLHSEEDYFLWRNKNDTNNFFIMLSKDKTVNASTVFLKKDINAFPSLEADTINYMEIYYIHEETGAEVVSDKISSKDSIKEIIKYFFSDGEYPIEVVNNPTENLYMIYFEYKNNKDIIIQIYIIQHNGKYYIETTEKNNYVELPENFFVGLLDEKQK